MATANCKLGTKDKNQISNWVGGSKEFVLLYKATRDGMSPPIIHRKIDNRGPTVMVFWNTDQRVFGGYASVNWFGTDEERFFYDSNAFLFQLKSTTNKKPEMYLIKQPAHALKYSTKIFPRFGLVQYLDDNVTAANENGIFVNNVKPYLGKAYQTGGKKIKDITNNNYMYTEVEIYKVVDTVLLSKPWRQDTMSKSQIKDYISHYCPVEESGVQQSRILFIGPVGSGKSSYVNTINSIFRGHVTSQAAAGSAERSLTTKFRSYQIRDDGEFLKFRLCDTRGLAPLDYSYHIDINAMLDGHMPDLYAYDPIKAITPVTPGYKQSPSLNDKIHCVAFIIDGSSLVVMNKYVMSQIKDIRNLLNERDIPVPQVILLTKVDLLAKEVDEDMNNLFYSSKVEKVVETVAQLIGLPRSHVLPVKNYEKETELNDAIDRYALLALQQILRFASDYLYNVVDTQANDRLENST